MTAPPSPGDAPRPAPTRIGETFALTLRLGDGEARTERGLALSGTANLLLRHAA